MPSRVVALVAFAGALLASGIYLLHAAREEPPASAAVPARHDPPPPSDPQTPAAPIATAPASGARRVIERTAPAAAAAERPQIATGDSDDTPVDDLEFGGSGGPKLEAIMSRANREYDRGEYAEAKAIAEKVLAKQPNNIRMERIMVSASCMDGDTAVGQKWYSALPAADRQAMAIRCKRNNVVYNEPQAQ